jgi:hypothetical protein
MSQINDKLKKIIFNKLDNDLSHAEIILHDNESIWLIDRDNKYWYLEFEKSGKLWWKYQFFTNFFQLFSLEKSEFEPIIKEWVEEFLDRKVVVTNPSSFSFDDELVRDLKSNLKETLNRKVVTMDSETHSKYWKVVDFLNRKVTTTTSNFSSKGIIVESILNQKNTPTYT